MNNSKCCCDGNNSINAADLSQFKFENGLIPAIVQDAATKEVLMFAYMNEDALKLTLETKIAHYWSRSRQSLWKKGETSGHFQSVLEIRFDCDADCLLLFVEQTGGACHNGYKSCFYRTVDGEIVGEKVFDEKDVY
ncbi:phosphoribosyl-AMP cyclohydrolase [Methanimicrococcus blatticola]|uniref:Phosphoribosyl-AMP cyclohydrolase n=1 Tax=Methanimicrococcus blatticola TaxID=91560 RepID=A0A484F4R2_9EURY|nr:phosphoribosyl-AMP cyclohydrolase [Methanimicrococcus blatticola]MBZ3936015.1 phosphoribosyl-AMP cyclohydrolase [Methanimicrococcus blatticola]MCC2509372.1 phosphoribosyl-AMP cyclohydrolase [Methanimicrococcus blatticola]TDQ68255.1 phosphoribosyl-AMP cyclohydrolase [Methanimicrococcus blatticola]